MHRATIVLLITVATLSTGCASADSVPSHSPAAAASAPAMASPATSLDPWAADLDQIDKGVRAEHPGPFANNPESVWVAKLAELRTSLQTASPDQRVVQLASLIGLLDTHSGLYPPYDAFFHSYDVLLYPFADGWFVVRAEDPKLVGSRVVSIGGHPIADVEAAFRPLVPSDNESGELDGLQIISFVEYLHGLGIVEDPAKPQFVLAKPDGTEVTVDVTSSDLATWSLLGGGGLQGKAPEAVARRGEPVWTRIDQPTKTFVISYNDYTENDLAPALKAMTAALDAGTARRVLVDMRYVRGGNGSLSDPLVAALAGDPRVNRPGGLIVMTGRENVSAGTVLARNLDTKTQAVLVGEMTPARADNFLCDCHDIKLVNSGLIVSIPTFWFGNGDKRPAIEPDIPIALTAADFFAGKDPALKAALALDDPQAP